MGAGDRAADGMTTPRNAARTAKGSAAIDTPIRRRALSVLLALPLAARAAAQEEIWLARPVRVVVPFSAGGSTDIRRGSSSHTSDLDRHLVEVPFSPARGRRQRSRLANAWPNLSAHCRTVSWVTMTPRAASNSSTRRKPNGTGCRSCRRRGFASTAARSTGIMCGAAAEWRALPAPRLPCHSTRAPDARTIGTQVTISSRTYCAKRSGV